MACQIMRVAMVTKLEGISDSNMMVDGAEVPSLRPMVHAEYVHNSVAYSSLEEPVASAARRVNA
eukprot:3006357-Pyramimonas_sp.AAC.1